MHRTALLDRIVLKTSPLRTASHIAVTYPTLQSFAYCFDRQVMESPEIGSPKDNSLLLVFHSQGVYIYIYVG